MIVRGDGTRYSVRLSVPRIGGVRAWGAVSGEFERRLAGQESPAVTAPRIESETRRGRDYVRVTILMTASAPDVAQALTAVWRAFRRAVGDDTAGWDMASTTAEVRPEQPLTARPGVHKPSCMTRGRLRMHLARLQPGASRCASGLVQAVVVPGHGAPLASTRPEEYLFTRCIAAKS